MRWKLVFFKPRFCRPSKGKNEGWEEGREGGKEKERKKKGIMEPRFLVLAALLRKQVAHTGTHGWKT